MANAMGPVDVSRVIACADGDEEYFRLLGDLPQRIAESGMTLDWHNGRPGSHEEWLARIGNADGLLLMWDIPDEVMRAAPNLKAIAWVGTAVSTFVNLQLADELGIRVFNTPGYGDNAVAEHALGLMLALARDTVALHNVVAAGGWAREDVQGVELSGKRAGIVGFGGIGRRTAQLCAALGMRVHVWTRNPDPARLHGIDAEFASLESIFAGSDVVSLHLPPTPDTIGLVTAGLIGRMPPHAFLINTARAELIDEAALLSALRERRIAGAALDVFSNEPPPADHPWRELDNVVLTPHVGFRTPEASGRSVRMALEQLLEC
jgi:D-3-phosphoglycerate dehydrogenase